jgi:glycosyltransferase involved in cell wall biosynthesis
MRGRGEQHTSLLTTQLTPVVAPAAVRLALPLPAAWLRMASSPEEATRSRSTRKRILVVTTRYPFPSTGGDKLRIAQLCEILSQEYDVSLVALRDTALPAPSEAEARLMSVMLFRQPKPMSWLLCLAGMFLRRPLQLYYFWNPLLRRYVNQHAREFDAIVFHLVRSTVFIPDRFDGRVILEMTDCMTLHYERARQYGGWTLRGIFYPAVEEARMRRLERNLANRFNAITVISEVDRDALSALDPRYRAKTFVFPNYIRPLPYRPIGQHRRRILFIGNMTALHNLDAVTFFAESVMPRLVERHPELGLHVIGEIAPGVARRLRRQPNVTVIGPAERIEDNVEGLLCGVAPMRFASGVQNKVIDYMALGIPALVSAMALEGIPARDGEEVLVCRDPEDYVWAIDRLLNEPDWWQRIASGGHAFANRVYCPGVIAADVLAAFRRLLQDDPQESSAALPRPQSSPAPGEQPA